MRRRPKDVSALERLTLGQTGVFLVGATWAFGGNADFVQPYLLAWGAAGAAITVAALLVPGEAQFRRRLLARLWPFLLVNFLTLWALRTPGFREIRSGGEIMLLPRFVPAWLPSSATPRLARLGLALFDGIYLSAFNLSALVRRRRGLRALLLLMCANAVALAVFGTLQKLSGAKGLYFGRVKSPQEFFFATFVYDNHWGAYIILITGAMLGLLGYHARHRQGRDVLHSPAFAAGVGLLILAISVPLSGARICSALTLVLLAADLFFWLRRQLRQPTADAGRSLGAAALVVLLAAGAVWFVARDVIASRVEKTREQVTQIRAERGLDGRLRLYRDTWRMGMARPWFGWGTGSYPHVFQLYNTAEPDPRDHLPKFFHDAHSDWLQTFAEHGAAGAVALGLCGAVPLLVVGRRIWNNRISRRLLAGCTLVLAYALIEFPFGNFAVTLTWWMLFFIALRYGILSENVAAARPQPA